MLTYTRNISFTTTEAGQNILTLDSVKVAIKERMGINTDEDYNRILNNIGFDMSFDIFCSATKVSINDGIYNELLEDTVYGTDGVYNGIKSIKIQSNNISGIADIKENMPKDVFTNINNVDCIITDITPNSTNKSSLILGRRSFFNLVDTGTVAMFAAEYFTGESGYSRPTKVHALWTVRGT